MDIDKALSDEELRGRFLKHTRRAYRLFPSLEQTRILDNGCDMGQQTMELTRLSGGEVAGIDIDHSAVSRLQQRIDQANVGDRIRVIHISLFNNKFDDDCFDIIWEEEGLASLGCVQKLCGVPTVAKTKWIPCYARDYLVVRKLSKKTPRFWLQAHGRTHSAKTLLVDKLRCPARRPYKSLPRCTRRCFRFQETSGV
jgi:hypothetical protein